MLYVKIMLCWLSSWVFLVCLVLSVCVISVDVVMLMDSGVMYSMVLMLLVIWWLVSVVVLNCVMNSVMYVYDVILIRYDRFIGMLSFRIVFWCF